MKALILAGGFGTRLRPITEKIPKVLVPINGKPLLAYHLDALQKNGINDVIINTHYLSEKIEDFSAEYRASNPEIKITLDYVPKLLGSAGTVKKNKEFFAGEKNFVVIYGDNFTNLKYKKICDFHEKKNGLISIASCYDEYPVQKGIIVYDENHRISKFIEKPSPDNIISHYINAGVYICSRKIFPLLDQMEHESLDFSYHVFPELLAKNQALHAYPMDDFLLDIGTPESYEKAQKIGLTLEF